MIQGAFYGIVICGMRNLRVWYGPLPELVCIAQAKMTQAVLTFGVVGIVMVTITKFVFICVWRSIRSMDDNLLKRIALNEIILLCFLHSWCWPQSNSSGSEVCTLYKLLLAETRGQIIWKAIFFSYLVQKNEQKNEKNRLDTTMVQ